MSSTTIAADYTSVKEDIINQSSLYFATMYPALSKAGQWGALLSMATALGDATARLLAFKPQLLADSVFHNTIFKSKQALEALSRGAETRGDSFIMPPCHVSIKSVTKWIHEQRASQSAAQPVTPLVTAVNTAAIANTPAPGPKPRRSARKGKAVKSPSVVESSDEEEDIILLDDDVPMGDSTALGDLGTGTDMMSVDLAMPGATLSLETPAAPPAVGSGAVPTGIKFSKSKGKEPAITSTDSTKAQAVAYAKAGFEEIQRKRQRSGTGSDYIKVAEGTTLAFPNSSAQIAAAASSSSSHISTTILEKANGLVSNISISPKSERALVKQEADLRSELDVTMSRINYLLQYFDIIQCQHVQVLKDLHLAENPSE